MLYNEIINSLLNRRSYRKYKDEPIEQEKLDTIFAAIQNTATSKNGQQFSVVAITDKNLKTEIMENAGGQEHLKKNGILLIFCTDYHKLKMIAQTQGKDIDVSSVEMLLTAVVDAALAVQTAAIAATSLGLQTCFIGYIRNKGAHFVSQKLELPQYVFPVCGLTIGYPEHQPNLKPKQSLPLFIHYNKYDDTRHLKLLAEYDATMETFNGLRADGTKRGNWSDGLIKDYTKEYAPKMMEWLKEQGFLQ